MTLAQLRTEFLARGFDFQTAARANQFLNDGMHEIVEAELWPFRLTTATGTSIVTLTDLGVIEHVVDTAQNSRPLRPMDRRSLVDAYSTLTTTGSPGYWYMDNGVVRAFPVGGTLSVRYYKAAADLSADADVPILPSRFHSLIVDFAQRRASIRDESDTGDYQVLAAECNQGLQEMRNALLPIQVQSPFLVDVGSGSTDW